MNIDNILAEYFPIIHSNRDNAKFFSCFSAERSLKVLISTFLSSIVVMYVFELDGIVVERIWLHVIAVLALTCTYVLYLRTYVTYLCTYVTCTYVHY